MNEFRREGEFWTIDYEGRLFHIRHSKGLGYIARLLERPGVRIHASSLSRGGLEEPAPRDAEHHRVSVTKRIKDALRKITANEPTLGAHLRSSIHTGSFCVYVPVLDLDPPGGERRAPITVSGAAGEEARLTARALSDPAGAPSKRLAKPPLA